MTMGIQKLQNIPMYLQISPLSGKLMTSSVQDNPLFMMEDLLQYFEEEAKILDAEMACDYFLSQGSNYTSVIKFDGRPILPPLMTDQKRKEMQMYKHQAVMAETRLKARARQRLLARVQAVMNDIELKEKKLKSADQQTTKNIVPPLFERETLIDEHNTDQSTSDVDVAQLNDIPKNSPRLETENIQSPGTVTVTKDSGVSSNDQTTSAGYYAAASLEDKQDTMVGISDIYSADDEMPSGATTSTVENSQERSSSACSVDEQISYISQESETVATGTYQTMHSDSDKENVDQQITASSSEDQTENTSSKDTDSELQEVPVQFSEMTESDRETLIETDENFKQQIENLPEFGSRERVDFLVKKLNSVLKIHEKQRLGVNQNLPSTSSSASGTTMSSASGTTMSSDEMNRTVIAREHTPQYVPEQDLSRTETDSATDVDTVELAESEDVCDDHTTVGEEYNVIENKYEEELEDKDLLRASLLSKVEFDTPEFTSEELSEQETALSDKKPEDEAQGPIICDPLAALKRYEGLPNMDVSSPGPVNTSDLSSISPGLEDSRAEISTTESQKAPINFPKQEVKAHNLTSSSGSPATESSLSQQNPSQYTSAGKSTETSQFYTTSTDLAPYMMTTSDTIPSSMTTLPYSSDQSANQTSGGTSLATPDSLNSQTKNNTQHMNSASPKEVSRIRRDSYTLEHPSPVLLAAYSRQKQEEYNSDHTNEASEASKSQGAQPTEVKVYNLTSSMEDLKLKPVHRKLDYAESGSDSLKPILKKSSNKSSPENHIPKPPEESEETGKEEHLQRYLQQLSQMPQYSSKQAQGNGSDVSGDASPDSEISKPQVLAPQQYGLPVELVNMQQMPFEDVQEYQAQYFEYIQQQMVEQQQQQLAQLLAVQQQQHILLQQELVQHPGSNLSKTNDALKRKQQLQRANKKLAGKSKAKSPRVPDIDPHRWAQVPQQNQQRISVHSTSVVSDPYDRPYSAPTPRVSFALGPENAASHAGVYCNQEFPCSPEDSNISYQNTSIEPGPCQSPAVLRPIFHAENGHRFRDHSGSPSNYTAQSTPPEMHQLENRVGRQQIPQYHLDMTTTEIPPSLQKKFDRVSAVAKGFLTRKLLKTDKVQQLIKTVMDTAQFALHFQQETPIKQGIYSHQDRILQDRVLTQLTAAMYEIHEVFFEITPRERMAHIHQSRLLEQEKYFREQIDHTRKPRRISSATKKALERKRKAKIAEVVVFGQERPKSCPPETSSPKSHKTVDLRALKPIQAQISPIKPGQTSPKLPVNGRGKAASFRPSPSVKRIKAKGAKHSKKNFAVPASRKVARPSSQVSARVDTRWHQEPPRPSSQPSTIHPTSKPSGDRSKVTNQNNRQPSIRHIAQPKVQSVPCKN